MFAHTTSRSVTAAVILLGGLLFAGVLLAHGVEGRDAEFLQQNAGRALLAFMYLGAKHMITGYDHLLYLLGVIFFLYRPKDIALYVTLFAVGHSITLLTAAPRFPFCPITAGSSSNLIGPFVNPYAHPVSKN